MAKGRKEDCRRQVTSFGAYRAACETRGTHRLLNKVDARWTGAGGAAHRFILMLLVSTPLCLESVGSAPLLDEAHQRLRLDLGIR